MLEVLITLVIIAIALLGTAGLQVSALRMGQSSQFRNLAIFLTSDIAERMEANKAGAVAGNYVVNPASSVAAATTQCTTTACTPAQLAGWDIFEWETNILGTLPQPQWSIDRAGVNPSTYTINIWWTDRSNDKTKHGETFSISATRTVSN